MIREGKDEFGIFLCEIIGNGELVCGVICCIIGKYIGVCIYMFYLFFSKFIIIIIGFFFSLN